MPLINSLYIPRLDNMFNAEFIANTFDQNGIAKVSKIYIEPYKSNVKNILENYNNIYIEIYSWYNTETAYKFIESLINSPCEARIICGHNKWWPVYINNYSYKLESRKRVLTIFKDYNMDDDDFSTIGVADSFNHNCNDFTNSNKQKKIHYISDTITSSEYDRELKAKIYGYKNAIEMEQTEAFDGYLHEMIQKKLL